MTQIKDEYEEPKFSPGETSASASTSVSESGSDPGPAEAPQFAPVKSEEHVPSETSVKKEEDTERDGSVPPHKHFGVLPMTGFGENEQESLWCSHSGGSSYHYHNNIYFKNPDRSSYFWYPMRGYSRYTDPNGKQYMNWDPHPEAELDDFCFKCKDELCSWLR